MVDEKFLSVRRNRAGDFVIEYQPHVIKDGLKSSLGRLSRRVVSAFSWLENIFTYGLPITSALGLGMGVSLAWFVYSQPMPTVATPEVTVKAQASSFQAFRKETQTAWLPFDQQSNAIELSWSFQPYLADMALGDTIELLGENNGIYRYQVTEIRYLESGQSARFIPPTNSLSLQAPINWFKTEYIVIVLR